MFFLYTINQKLIMNHKKLTNFLVFFFMLAGAALMAYGELERNDLQDPNPVETVEKSKKSPCSKRAG